MIKIPIGVENFKEIRTDNCYYVDKTKFILELFEQQFSVNLITRPRRFGKTLMLNMLKHFFDIRKDSKELFEGLVISQNKEICAEWMNQWPVLFISFKDIAARTYQSSYAQLVFELYNLCVEHAYLEMSEKIDKADKEFFLKMKQRSLSEEEVKNGLLFFMRMLHAHYGKQVILLIDEYDVPLAKADEYGYYQEMLDLIRGFMSVSLKTNEHLKFAIVTGCLRIAKESIFTGANHFVNHSIDDGKYMDAFGFTEEEVTKLLQTIDREKQLPLIKRWYDGYRFGDYEMYCPWDIVNYVSVLQEKPNAFPRNYWKDPSHNNIIRRFIGNENFLVNEKFETLLSGESILAQIRDDLTYDFDNSTEDNLWSILYLTGYLTKENENENSKFTSLKIPNEEIKTIFADTVVEWFQDTMQTQDRTELFEAWWIGDDVKLTALVSEILFDTISYYDYREDFYHAFLAGIFIGAGYSIESNREMGLGRTDIVVKDGRNRRALIIEVKHSNSEEKMEEDCKKALEQIKEKQYAKSIPRGYKSILCYGATFFEKSCFIQRL